MALAAIWFSDATTTAADKPSMKARSTMIKELSGMVSKIQSTLAAEQLTLYRKIAEFLKDKQSLFVLGKGVGLFAANYIASKFLQVTSIHAEAYSSAEFRHGPLSMIDETVNTPGKLPSL
jgi:glucosamine 6-phosphate synthetase-like amidotransferase/phosphosugar isomerase protein